MRSAIVAMALLLGLTPAPGAPAKTSAGVTQEVSVSVQVSLLSSQRAEVCLNDECRTVTLTDGSGADELTLWLEYTLADRGSLPSVDGAAPLPEACEANSIERMGASILASGAKFSERSSAELVQGGETIATMKPSRRPSRTDAVSAMVCLLNGPG